MGGERVRQGAVPIAEKEEYFIHKAPQLLPLPLHLERSSWDNVGLSSYAANGSERVKVTATCLGTPVCGGHRVPGRMGVLKSVLF